ncbi:MAG: hypothetical protein GEV11_19045 [Streptosporangiales bacterium]|nr:hypothetical protein [Streptosporangiales bacterium]
MLTPFDDYPIHQAPVPLAHSFAGHPDHYDRFWFNGYTEDYYFAVALGTYPGRGVIDAAFSVVRDGEQRSVFASGRMPLDPTQTRIGPISIEIVEPLRTCRIVVDAPEHGLGADLTFRARTAAFEEPRQTLHRGRNLIMDVTRMTQWGTWGGALEVTGRRQWLDGEVYGTKDRSWGIRPVGGPVPAAPPTTTPQLFFLWAPLHFPEECLHFLVFEDAAGRPWSHTAAALPPLGPDDPAYGPGSEAEHFDRGEHAVRWAPGLRRSDGATITLHGRAAGPEVVELEPLMTFRMRGAGYTHPTRGHGVWHDELSVHGEAHPCAELDSLDPSSIHIQQVMRCTWGDRRGLGVLEQLAIGPHAPSGFKNILDGAPG